MNIELKNNKIIIGRSQLIGDQICALPIARYFKKLYPDSYLIWPIAKKISQIAPIYINCKWINEIYVTDGQEGWESERDYNKLKSVNYSMEINPQHPDSQYPQKFNIYSETWRMGGLNYEVWESLPEEEKRPKLEKWWNPVKIETDKKIIGIWAQAGYSIENKRNPSKQYWEKLIKNLIVEGYEIYQFGSQKDWVFFEDNKEIKRLIKRCNDLSLFDQIKIALECSICLGTDSGSSLVLGAYSMNFISLIPVHWGNENNPSALSTNNPNNYSFYSIGGTDNIDMELVIAKIQEKVGKP